MSEAEAKDQPKEPSAEPEATGRIPIIVLPNGNAYVSLPHITAWLMRNGRRVWVKNEASAVGGRKEILECQLDPEVLVKLAELVKESRNRMNGAGRVITRHGGLVGPNGKPI